MMKMSKRILFLCLSLVILAGLTFGVIYAHHRMSTPNEDRHKPTPKKTITLSVWTPEEDQTGDQSWLSQMEESFQKAHPEYKIIWDNGICSEAEIVNMMSDHLDDAPDVYMFANDQLGKLKDMGVIQKLGGKHLDQVLTDNSQTMINTVTHTNDGIYGFPISSQTWFLLYNKDYFTDEDVKSLDTMLTKGTVAFPWRNHWYGSTFFLANGGTLFGEKGNDASAGIQFGLDNGGYEAALKMVQFAQTSNFRDASEGNGQEDFKQGNLGAIFTGSWDVSVMRNALGDKLGFAVPPTVEINGQQKQMKAFASSMAVAANAMADYPQLAADFAAHLATPEAQKLRHECRSVVPAAMSLVNDPDISQDEAAVVAINTTANAATVQPFISEMNQYWTPMSNFGDGVASGSINERNYRNHVSLLLQFFNGQEDPTPVTLRIWTPEEDQFEDGWLETMESAFAAEHPELEITWINEVCHESDAGSLVTADPEAAADVYMFANDQIETLLYAGAITRLDGQYLEQVLADNSQNLVNTVTHTDGNVYGFPVANNTWFMYYDKKVFTEDDVRSLDTMLSKGRVAFPMSIGWYSGSFFLANGGTLFGDHGNDAAAGIQFGEYNGGYEAALKMIQLANHHNMVDDLNGIGYSGLRDRSVGAYFSGSWDYPNLYEALGDDLGIAIPPSVEIGGRQQQMKAFTGSKAIAVNPHTSEPQLAAAFAAYLATPESQKVRYEKRGVIPAAASLVNDPMIRRDPLALAEMNTVSNASVAQPTIPEMSYYWNPMGNFGSLVATGAITLDNYKEQVDLMMEDLNSTGL